MSASRVVLGESGSAQELAPLDTTLPVTGLAMLGEEPQRFMFDFAGLLRNVPVLEHAAAGRGQFRHVGDQAGLDPFLIRDGVTAKLKGISLACLAFFVCVALTGGRGSESDPSQYAPQRDQFLHHSAPVTAASCGQQV